MPPMKRNKLVRGILAAGLILGSSLASAQQSEEVETPATYFYVEKSDVEVTVDTEKNTVKIKTPQKKVNTTYEFTEYISNGTYTGLAYFGTEYTVVVSDTWVSMASDEGEVFFWFYK